MVACFAVTWPEAAHAQSSGSTEAQRRKQEGNAAMESGRPADALELYQQAFALDPNPALLYNMGRAHMALGDYPNALVFLERFDERAPAVLKRRVSGLKDLIDFVKVRVATVSIRANVAGAVVRLDDKRLGKTPFDGPIEVNAGTAVVEVSAKGYMPHVQKVDLEGGEATEIEVKLESEDTHGILRLRSPEPSVRVIVDGRYRGMVPVEVRLEGGQHRIELRKDGFEPVSTQVVVRAGRRKTVSIPMEATPEFYERWWFWTGVGVLTAGTVAAIVLHDRETEPDTGTIPPGRVKVGLEF